MINSFITAKMPELNNIFNHHQVKSVHLFGSALTDSFNESSDVDLLVDMGNESDPVKKGESMWSLYYDLRKLLKREVDIVTKDSLVNKYFIEELNSTSIAIYG